MHFSETIWINLYSRNIYYTRPDFLKKKKSLKFVAQVWMRHTLANNYDEGHSLSELAWPNCFSHGLLGNRISFHKRTVASISAFSNTPLHWRALSERVVWHNSLVTITTSWHIIFFLFLFCQSASGWLPLFHYSTTFLVAKKNEGLCRNSY